MVRAAGLEPVIPCEGSHLELTQKTAVARCLAKTVVILNGDVAPPSDFNQTSSRARVK
jgi:hypothetical protein